MRNNPKKVERIRVIRLLIPAICICLLITGSTALLNPSAVYCRDLGYNYTVHQTPYGEAGYCLLPNGEEVDAWAFLQGKVAEEYSYCQQQGYQLEIVTDRNFCSRFKLDNCSACILDDGRIVEVTEFMGLEFWETSCGDKACSDPENYLTCPEDCGPDSADGYCNREMRSTDPDCSFENELEDTISTPPSPDASLDIAVILAGSMVAIILLMRRR